MNVLEIIFAIIVVGIGTFLIICMGLLSAIYAYLWKEQKEPPTKDEWKIM